MKSQLDSFLQQYAAIFKEELRNITGFQAKLELKQDVDPYPMPTQEDLMATLAGGQLFSKLDLSSACLQVPLHPESRKYVTINTHRGLYQYT